MKLEKAIKEYLDYSTYEAGHSKKSVAQRACKLKVFIRFLFDEYGWSEPTARSVEIHQIRSFLRHLTEARGVCPKTARTYIEALRGLYTYLLHFGYVEDSPAHRVKLPKANPPKRELASNEEILRMFSGTRLIRNIRRSAMARAYLAVLVYGGLRTSELLDLEVSDLVIEDTGCIIQVRCGKGGKRRAIPINREAIPYLLDWLDLRGKAKHPYLFAYDPYRRLGKYTVRSLFEEIKFFAGIDRPDLKPHALRHQFSTRLLANGVNLHHIQLLLGHSSVTTTISYLHSDINQLREVVERSGGI